MPTRRAWAILALGMALYFLANQTQVGWLYLMADGIVGFWLVALVYGWGMLRPLQATRSLLPPDGAPSAEPLADAPTFHEGDPIHVTLRVENRGGAGVFLLRGEEHCPFAPSDEQEQPFFIPVLLRNKQATLRYATICDRRGHYRFSPLRLSSDGPFGFVRRQRALAVPSEILIYPYYHRLRRLRLLESKKLPERQAPRIGAGSEAIGVREYRPGDSPRLVHWRSTARTGRLVVKEFADEEQPALTVALDLHRESSVGEGKHATFEVAVRIAATLGYFATRRGIPFHLAGSSPRWTPPRNALGWWGVLNYLARVENDGEESFSQLLHKVAGIPLLVVLISHPNEAILQALTTLQRRGTRALALFITPDGSLPPAAASLKLSGLEVKVASPHNWEDVLES